MNFIKTYVNCIVKFNSSYSWLKGILQGNIQIKVIPQDLCEQLFLHNVHIVFDGKCISL